MLLWMSAASLIGRRRPPEADLTLDCALFLGLVLLAAVLLMWHMPPAKPTLARAHHPSTP
jgi:hypothetical protein